MNNLLVGTITSGKVIREIETGYVLDIDDNDILLHYNDMNENEKYETEDDIEVFLYNDKNVVTLTKAIDHLLDSGAAKA